MDHTILEQYIDLGLTEREIAEKSNFSQSTIVYWLRKYGLRTKWKRGGWSREDNSPKNGRKHRNPEYSGKNWDWLKIQARYDEGKTQKDLCKEFGLNFNIISRARKSGLFKSRTTSEASKLSHANVAYDYSVYRTPEHRKKMAKFGGYKPGSGRGNGAWFTNIAGQSIYLQSSFEIRMATLLNKAGILWERPESIPYTIYGSEHRYYPDFLLPNFGVYLDTKNDYLIDLHAPKLEAVKKQSGIILYVVTDKQINGNYLSELIPAAKDKLKDIQVLPKDWAEFYVPKPKRSYIPHPLKTKMPEAEVLAKLIWEMPLTKIAIKYGVCDSAIHKWINKLKIDRPPTGYWARRQKGWTHEEALRPWPKGEAPQRKLTDQQVVAARKRIAKGEKIASLAREYKVCHKTMRDIRDRQSYKEIS